MAEVATSTHGFAFERHQPYTSFGPETRVKQHPLYLDCSSDLRAYSRSLGPHAQREKNVVPTPHTVHQAQGPPLHLGTLAINHPTNHPTVPASQPHHFQAPPTQYAPLPLSTTWSQRPPRPDPKDPSTYPPGLREALDQYHHFAPKGNDDDNTVYTLIEHTDRDYMEDSTTMIGHYRTLHAANTKAVEHILESGIYDSNEEEAVFSLDGDGGLEFENHTDGSMGGQVHVYIRRQRIGD